MPYFQVNPKTRRCGEKETALIAISIRATVFRAGGPKNSCWFEPFQSGKIDAFVCVFCLQSIDDYDLPKWNISYLRENMSLVSQEPALFDRTIRENIVYGLNKAPSDESIENAAKIANIHDFVITLPQVYTWGYRHCILMAQFRLGWTRNTIPAAHYKRCYRWTTGPSYNYGWSLKIARHC